MRKIEKVDIIPEKKIVTVTYYGNCPECKKEQQSRYPSDVDKLCGECKLRKKVENIERLLESYIGSQILKINYNNSEIIIKSKDGKVYIIWIDIDYAEYEKHFEVEEIHEGNAEWFQP